MNITDQQRALLLLLVLEHDLTGGAQFILVRSFTNAGLCYRGGVSIPCNYEDADFYQLQRQNLITLFRNAEGNLCGGPTELGIKTAHQVSPGNSFVDPWQHNPFPEGTKAHEYWEDTRLWAKEHFALFQVEMSKTLPPEKAPAGEFVEHTLNTIEGAYDIWAQAFGRNAVLTKDAADASEHLLTAIEEAMVVQASNLRGSYLPKGFMSEVKFRLSQRKQYWVGQRLRRVREHAEAMRAAALAKGPKPQEQSEKLHLPVSAIVTDGETRTDGVDPVEETLRLGRDAPERARAVNDAAPASTTNIGAHAPTEPPKSARRRQQMAAELNAVYSRRLGWESTEVARQEELLHDAREWAAMSLPAALEELELPFNASAKDIDAACVKIRDRIVLDTLNNYVLRHIDPSEFHLGVREFKWALWTEGDSSLEDRARASVQERVVRGGARTTKSEPTPALDRTTSLTDCESEDVVTPPATASEPEENGGGQYGRAFEKPSSAIRRRTHTTLEQKAPSRSRACGALAPANSDETERSRRPNHCRRHQETRRRCSDAKARSPAGIFGDLQHRRRSALWLSKDSQVNYRVTLAFPSSNSPILWCEIDSALQR